MSSGAKGHARIDYDAQPAGRRGIVAPLGHKEKPRAYTHRRKPAAGFGYPVARLLGLAEGRPFSEFARQDRRFRVFREEGPQAAAIPVQIGLRDAVRPALPKPGNELIFLLLPTFQI